MGASTHPKPIYVMVAAGSGSGACSRILANVPLHTGHIEITRVRAF